MWPGRLSPSSRSESVTVRSHTHMRARTHTHRQKGYTAAYVWITQYSYTQTGAHTHSAPQGPPSSLLGNYLLFRVLCYKSNWSHWPPASPWVCAGNLSPVMYVYTHTHTHTHGRQLSPLWHDSLALSLPESAPSNPVPLALPAGWSQAVHSKMEIWNADTDYYHRIESSLDHHPCLGGILGRMWFNFQAATFNISFISECIYYTLSHTHTHILKVFATFLTETRTMPKRTQKSNIEISKFTRTRIKLCRKNDNFILDEDRGSPEEAFLLLTRSHRLPPQKAIAKGPSSSINDSTNWNIISCGLTLMPRQAPNNYT